MACVCTFVFVCILCILAYMRAKGMGESDGKDGASASHELAVHELAVQ
jgi:hypothetical protein